MEEVAFPRGNTELKDPGSKVLEEAKNNRPSKRKIPSKEAPTPKTDFLFGSASKKSESASSKPKSKRQKTGSAKQSLLPVGGGGVITVQKHGKKDEPLIESLSFNKLAKGTKLLGMVREVHDEFAVFSLPNFLTGYMLPEKGVSLLKCLSVGQCLAVTVVKIVTEHVKGGTSKRRIQVTAKPSALNSTDEPMSNIPLRGQILSVEDHGCLVDMGFGRKGFLSFDQVDGEYDILEEDVTPEPTDIRILQKGRIFDFMLAAPAKGTVYKLSLPSSQKLAKHTIIPLQNKTPSLASLAPGWLVTAKLDVLAKNGLCVTFFGNVFRAAVEMGHLGAIFKTDIREVSSEWKGIFSKNQSFPARIMAVDPATKLIRLSLQPHLLEISIPDDLPDVGTLIEGCTVVRQDPGIGALLALPDEFSREDDENANHPGLMAVEKYRLASNIKGVYVHISKAIDEKDSSLFAKEFAPSTTHSVRILSKLNWIDGVASGACSPSLIEAHVLTHADLKPGQVHKQVPIIAHLKDGGVLVNLGSGIRGLIPPMHLFETAASSEYRRKLMRVKFAVDSKVDVLVLWTDSKRKRCLLSAKKGLVKSDKVITSYSDMSVGTTATGFVSKVDDKALFVTFCDRVYGKITARSLVKDVGIEDHTANFHVGDIVTCRVVNIKKRRRNQKEDESDSEDDDVDIPSSKPFYEVNLALAVQGAEEKEVEFDEPELLHINTGGLLPSKSIKVLELVKGKEKKTGFVPGYAVVSVRSKYLLRENDSAKAPSSMECKLPYDQLEDDYDPECLKSAAALDKFAENMLSVGQKLEQKGFILSDPGKSNIEYSNAIGKFAVLSLRQKLVDQLEKQSKGKTKASGQMLPGIDTEFFVGSQVIGYVAQVDERHGAFVRFLDGLTGLVPKKQGALNLKPYSTVVSRVEIVDDSRSPPRILLKPLNGTKKIPTPEKSKDKPTSFQVGDVIEEATITNLGFHRAILHVPSKDANVTLHCSMKQCPVKSQAVSSKKNRSSAADGPMITSDHPFYKLKKGKTLKGLTVFSVGTGKDSNIVQVTDFTSDSEEYKAASQFESKHKVQPGTILSGVVTGVAKNAKGVYVALSPSISGFIPALELSEDVKLLNNMEETLVLGQRLKSCVIDQAKFYEARSKAPNQKHAKSSDDSESYMLSTVLAQRALDHAFSKPVTGDIVIGRLNSKVRQLLPPSMMVDLRGGYIGRCCITELEEPDEWENMPLGRPDQDEDDEEDDDR
jgi:ribosomal protein S1